MFELQTIQGDGFWSAAPRHSAENAVRRFASKELELSYIPEQTMKTSLISETKFRESPSAVLPETSSNPREPPIPQLGTRLQEMPFDQSMTVRLTACRFTTLQVSSFTYGSCYAFPRYISFSEMDGYQLLEEYREYMEFRDTGRTRNVHTPGPLMNKQISHSASIASHHDVGYACTRCTIQLPVTHAPPPPSPLLLPKTASFLFFSFRSSLAFFFFVTATNIFHNL
ncbi:hypothetical protein CH63R_03263 [Colletotrichum higginsianum IMI 349063]|uniref:Uncharacterized protein n=1 Tax=Colletotrichum higginsianum (strain IMI 349063) TaxID=759273 RepID=A0A1B7YR65_COLHI|nr:hypothetical protein CH63R_03263 [Colletotrichum higginsianum IMI 349063]OBR14537.1 hypothetical protein CH63R_03263 [Colletotrichum higginsianum IMI 349063]